MQTIQYPVRKKLSVFYTRMLVCFNIITGRWKHWVVIHHDDKTLRSLIEGGEFTIKIVYCGSHDYLVKKMIKTYADGLSEADMIISETNFESQALVNMNKS